MRVKTYFFFLSAILSITCFFPLNIKASDSAKIQGQVIDKESTSPIPEVNIEILGTTRGDVSDSSGAYQLLNLSEGVYSIKASRIGFEPQVIENIVLKAGEIYNINITLTPAPILLKEVKIEKERLWDKYLTEASLVGVERMRSQDVTTIPGALDDPVRAVQIFSGVSGGGDYSGYLAVRGGSPDQNQVLMDGFVIPNPYRFRLAFGAGLSIINPSTTQDLYMNLGGFSAEYGNALSSILEVSSRFGNRHQVRTQASINFTDISGVIEGPFMNGNGSYLFSVRRTYYDFIANRLSGSNSVFPYYYEFSTKWAIDLNADNRVLINFTRNKEGTDLLNEFSEEFNLTENGKSNIANITWRKMHGEQWQFNTGFSYYHDKMDYQAFQPSDTSALTQDFEALRSKVINFSFKEDIRFKTGMDSWLNWGFSATTIPSKMNFNSSKLQLLYARIETPKDFEFDKAYQYYATYLESSAKVLENLHLRIGARYDYSTLISDGELSPRFSIWYKLNDRTSIEGSWGIFYQYPNPLTIYSRNIPIDLSANLDVISAEKAAHQIMAIERNLTENLFAKLQIYNKDLDDILLPDDEIDYKPVNNGKGFARGFEFILEKRPTHQSRINGIISYSYGKAKYRSLEDNNWLPFKFDRRHALTLLCNMKLFGNWKFSLLGQYSSGFPYTEVVGLINKVDYYGHTNWQFLKGSRLASRFPSYTKMDVRLSYQRRAGDKAFSFYLDIINITNQQNVYEYTWEKRIIPVDGQDEQEATRRTIYMMPFIPSFGVSFQL